MATIFIKSLLCRTTEDDTGSDECLLEVFSDAGRKSYRQDLNNGESWEINDSLPFTEKAKVRLWDLDLGRWPDYNDHLGTSEIPDRPTRNATTTFTQDGADYELTYDVIP